MIEFVYGVTVSYDKIANASNLYLTDRSKRASHGRTVPSLTDDGAMINLDLGTDQKLYDIEVLDSMDVLPPEILEGQLDSQGMVFFQRDVRVQYDRAADRAIIYLSRTSSEPLSVFQCDLGGLSGSIGLGFDVDGVLIALVVAPVHQVMPPEFIERIDLAIANEA